MQGSPCALPVAAGATAITATAAAVTHEAAEVTAPRGSSPTVLVASLNSSCSGHARMRGHSTHRQCQSPRCRRCSVCYAEQLKT